MWYDGVYACGHEGRVNVVGPGKDRDWKVKKHFERICPECYQKQRAEEAQKIKEESNELGWPELTGTEKQIVWALSIRKKTITEMKEKSAPNEAINWILGKTNSGFWIETANNGLYEVIKAYKKENL